MEWTPKSGEQERHNVTVITVGSKYEVYVRSPAPSYMQTLNNPFQTLQIKREVKILEKKSSCVFILRRFFLCLPLASFCVRLYYWVVMIRQMSIQHKEEKVNSSLHEYLECWVKVCSSSSRNREKILRVCGLNPWLSGGVGQHVLVPLRRECGRARERFSLAYI